MTIPAFQVGDTVRPGMAVVQIPDLENWEAVAKVSELDRGQVILFDKLTNYRLLHDFRCVANDYFFRIHGYSFTFWNCGMLRD
jgi:hypothetical protein